MLSTIKNIISQKKSFQEAADLILENEALDDSILLNESSEDEFKENGDAPVAEPSAEPEQPVAAVSESDGEENPASEEGVPEGGETAPETTPNESGEETPVTPAEGETPTEEPVGDILDEPIEDPDGNELPTPVGAQTGEPAQVGTDEIISTEIDLGSGTMTDTLPTPPANAADAVVSDDILDTKIDDGFEPEKDPVPENPVNILDEPFGDEEPLAEGITLGGEGEEAPAEEDGTEAAPEGGESGEEAPTEGEGDNAVTSAVKDKVEEIQTEEEPAEGEPEVTRMSQEDLMKKLSSITKSLEDAKSIVMSQAK